MAVTLCSCESSSGMKAPERSRASLNATAPSPIASVVGPSGVTQLSEGLGREHAREQQRGLELARPRSSASSPRTPRRGARRAPRARCRNRPGCSLAGGPASASDCSVETPTSGMSRARASARAGRDPDPQPRERSRPDADPDPIDLAPADPGALQHHRGQGQQPRGVAGPRVGLWVVAGRVDDVADARQRDRGRARRGVERQDPHGTSIVTTRRSPPACSMVTRAARRDRPAIVATAFSGHSTNAIRSGPM